MKHLALSLCIAACAVACAEDDTVADNAGPRKRTKEEIRESVFMKTGRFIFDKRNAEGRFVFVNAQQKVPVDVLASAAQRLINDTWIPIEIQVGGPVNIETAQGAFDKLKCQAAVFIVEDSKLPVITVVPESRWALLNVGRIAVPGVPDDKVADRTFKEMVRSMSFVFGAGYSSVNKVGLQVSSVQKPEDLDLILLKNLPIETSSQIQRTAKDFGITGYRRCFYSKAVEEGWAPPPKDKYQESAKIWAEYKMACMRGTAAAPTNQWQRDVWKMVHDIPKTPMKIEFDPATQKGKVTK